MKNIIDQKWLKRMLADIEDSLDELYSTIEDQKELIEELEANNDNR